MARNQGEHFTPEQQNNSSKSTHASTGSNCHTPTTKPTMNWEQPDFEELDLCMEVTTYVYHWQ